MVRDWRRCDCSLRLTKSSKKITGLIRNPQASRRSVGLKSRGPPSARTGSRNDHNQHGNHWLHGKLPTSKQPDRSRSCCWSLLVVRTGTNVLNVETAVHVKRRLLPVIHRPYGARCECRRICQQTPIIEFHLLKPLLAAGGTRDVN